MITKTPFYQRGNQYQGEKVTQAFNRLAKHEIGSIEYNILKTEQLLKVKIKAIIDTANNNEDFIVLPILCIFKILKSLKDCHKINSCSLDLFYTYILTCKNLSECEIAVNQISTNSPPANEELLGKYKDLSRIPQMIKNINLFIFDTTTISLNDDFTDYFQSEFMDKFDIDELNAFLRNELEYNYFLTHIQGFNVDLISEQDNKTSKFKTYKKTDKKSYNRIVDETNIENINDLVAENAHKREPVTSTTSLLDKISRNPILGKIAISSAKYQCLINSEHTTFTSRASGKPYMEPHHILPISKTQIIWDKYKVNIDCLENIVSLCPNCHRAIHYANEIEQLEILRILYEKKKDSLRSIGLKLTIRDLKKYLQ